MNKVLSFGHRMQLMIECYGSHIAQLGTSVSSDDEEVVKGLENNDFDVENELESDHES